MKKKYVQFEKRSKESVGLAGEYAVASELCRRGHYAQLTLGNHKKTDLLFEIKSLAPGYIFRRISVKAKTGNEWPKVKGIADKGDILIFVDFKGKEDIERPDFYVLDVDSWKNVMNFKKSEIKGSKIDKKTNTLIWETSDGKNNGWLGCAVRVEDVVKYKEQWKNVEI